MHPFGFQLEGVFEAAAEAKRGKDVRMRLAQAVRRGRFSAFTYEREDGYVFVKPETAEPWNSTAAQRDNYWTPAMKELGYRHRTPYSTCSTSASRMLMRGAKPAWCAKQLGHSKEMFFRVYTELDRRG